MAVPSDENLLQLCSQGDEQAFVQLIHRYGQSLAGYIRSQISHPDDAEDVLQETLLAAWISLRQLRDPGSVRAWLLQVARNRCRDYFRARDRRAVPMETRVLQRYADRYGLRRYRDNRLVTDAVEALETIPPEERETARRFYLQGLSIAEIADATQSPPGTVKRRLFQARSSLRAALDVPFQERSFVMEKQAKTAEASPFPAQRPQIVISPSIEPLFAVNCPELRWWSIIPRSGEIASWAAYNPPDWSLAERAELQVIRPAQVHDVEGVEIEVRQWKAKEGWEPTWTMYGRLTDQKAQYLATTTLYNGSTLLHSFLDEVFNLDWGEMDRVVEDQGRIREGANGSFKQLDTSLGSKIYGCGIFSVHIGGNQFTCLRVLEFEDDVNAKGAVLTESYITREGRTVLTRHHCRPDFVDVAEFEVIVEPSEQLLIDGATFVHWYDTLTNLAL